MAKKKKEDSITIEKAFIRDANVTVREYSNTEHGENFKLLAEQFAQKHNYTVIYGE